MPELVHGIFKLGFGHLAVGHAHAGRRNKPAHVFRHALQPLHTVVDPEYLAFTLHFAFHHLAQHVVVPAQHGAGHGFAVLRRCFDDGKLADAGQGKLQGARYGRGGQGEGVHVLAHGLELFFMAHAKPLLFIKDEQGQIGQLHVGGQNAVGADEDVHLPGGSGLEHFFLLGARHKTAEQPHIDGKARQARPESLVMLFGQHGGGAEHGHLPPLGGGAEGGAQGHLCFAEAHVAAHKAIHGA